MDWYIQYRFYDPVHKPEGKQRIIKGMNECKTVLGRQQLVERAIREEMALLQGGYNIVTEAWTTPAAGEKGELEEHTPLSLALQIAFKRLTCDANTIPDVRSMLNWVPIAVEHLGYQFVPVSEVRKKHVRRILDQCATIKSRVDPVTKKTITVTWSNDKFNKYRSYLMMLFSEIVEAEAMDANPCKDIRKKKVIKKKRLTLTKHQRVDVDKHLHQVDPDFHRFLHIFFHSGARETEIMAVQGKHVDLASQKFLRLIKKDSDHRWEPTTIKDIALSLWKEALEGCGPEDFVFSVGFQPGPRRIREDQIGRRWRKKVKLPLKIEADFYSLKHSNTTETSRIAGHEAAARQNGQKGTAMVRSIYDVDRTDREHEQLKKVYNPFAG